MEEHRLIPMPDNYDKKLFLSLMKDTKALRNKLAYGIDHTRYGVEKEDLVSWFNTKLIFIFSKYYGQVDNNVLKGKIISGLQFYRNRILRYSYTKKNTVNQTSDISEFYSMESNSIISIEEEESHTLDEVFPLFKSKLDAFSYHILTIDYAPPIFILAKLDAKESKKKIPEALICQFLEIEHTNEVHHEILNARRKYRKVIALIQANGV
jgi:hypothetical protein